MPDPIDPKAARGASLEAARKRLGLTQEQMAAAMGLSGSADWRSKTRGRDGMSGPARRLLAILTDPRCPDWVRDPTI